MEQEVWLNKMTLTQRQEITVSRQELLGVLLIVGFVAVIMLTIITDENQYLPQTQKNKEQMLEAEWRGQRAPYEGQKLC